MPLPARVFHPPFTILRLSHVVMGVTDLEASKRFYADIFGLQISHEESGQICLRAMEERNHHSLRLIKDSAARIHRIGFKLAYADDLERAAIWFAEQDLPVSWSEAPHIGRVLHVTDHAGVPLEFYVRMERLESLHQRYALYHGVRPLRIDHVNLFSAHVDDAVDFYHRIGFRTTEYTEDAETGRLWAAWLHRKGGVHDIAFTNGLGPRMHHIAYWVSDPLRIIDLLDLMATTGYVGHIERGPGRHGISNAFFLYIRDPDGHRIEIYCSDYQTLDPDHEPIKWDLKDPQRQTLWGAPAPRSWFEEGAPFDGVSAAEADLKATPIIAP